MSVKRLKVRLLTPPEDVSWGPKYIATALGSKGFQIVEPHEGKIVLDKPEPPVHSVLWSSQGTLYLGTEDKIIVLDRNLEKKYSFEVPSQVEHMVETKDKKVLAVGEGWLAKIEGKGIEIFNVGYSVWRVAGKGEFVALGSKDGRLLIFDLNKGKVIWSADFQSIITGLSWGPFLLASDASGHIYSINTKDETFEFKVLAKYKNVSDLMWNPKGDEIVVSISSEKRLAFLNQLGSEVSSVDLEGTPTSLDYSPTSIEVVVVLENGELETVATPKAGKVVEELVKASKCIKEGKVVCEALEKALWRTIGMLAPDVNVDEFYALKQLGEKMPELLVCLQKRITDLRKVIRNIITLEDVVEVLKGGCERFERWLDTIVNNATCIVKLSEELEKLFDIASADLLAAQVPTSVHLAEQMGCERALELVKCAIKTYKKMKDVWDAEEELGISLPPPGEVVVYLFLVGDCEEVYQKVSRLSELKELARQKAAEGDVESVIKIVREANAIAEELREKVETALPEGILE
ncbi:TPA: WD40 repeat domain-containing protein [Desulfurococcaceae archaeon]|nr:WD40 repeat domain-containing protein [Desulfurococcaceae archaeon]